MCWFFKFLVLYSAHQPSLPLGRDLANSRLATAVRFQREVTMESTLTGPILYLLIAWGIVTAVFLVLLIWRSLLESHEDDQIFLDLRKTIWQGSSASWFPRSTRSRVRL